MNINDIKADPIVINFDETNRNWTEKLEYNKYFLRATFQLLDEVLNRQGHLFVNEFLDALGVERTREGAVLGWIQKEKPREIWSYTIDTNDRITVTLKPDGLIWDKI